MRVAMLHHISGGREGQPWPLKGGELDVSDDEGADLIRINAARPVVESAAAPEATVETATIDNTPAGK